MRFYLYFFLILLSQSPSVWGQSPRPRAREIGIEVGILAPGKFNAITDVKGVRVGYKTVWKGKNIRTGVTAILPHGGNIFQEKVPAAIWVGNGFGKLAGYTQLEELGNIETPIVLTNTLSVPTAVKALINYTLSLPGNEEVHSINAVVGETNDGYLNDIRGLHVTEGDVLAAIKNARAGPVEEGAVGAGTGTRCLGFKGGMGTSSRVLPMNQGGYVVGVLVQTNFGGILTINGAPVGRELGKFYLSEGVPYQTGGSCMIVVATDAPLSPRNLKRLAKRGWLGLARTGSFSANGSGDYVIAFSTAYRIPYDPGEPSYSIELLHNDFMSPLFLAVVEATEEAVYNSLLKATTVKGRDEHQVRAIPVDKIVEICKKYNVLNLHRHIPPKE
ncbi:P1 family peptidase [candidate division KSB1 bacterium]|nr:P1 family peptidase [candidate division KSB1 bacterium]